MSNVVIKVNESRPIVLNIGDVLSKPDNWPVVLIKRQNGWDIILPTGPRDIEKIGDVAFLKGFAHVGSISNEFEVYGHEDQWLCGAEDLESALRNFFTVANQEK